MSEFNSSSAPADRNALPWFVQVSPEFYDDAYDVGFGWEGWARDEVDAVRQALEACHKLNERGRECRKQDLDPRRAKVHVAEIDFRRFAGPLMHWAITTGNAGAPIWKAMLKAVAVADLAVAPLEQLSQI